jgi:hypothetical protein
MARSIRLLLVAIVLTVAAPATLTSDGLTQLPPRDVGAPGPSRTGTAAIRGRVLDLETSRPSRRARVTLTAPELGREGITASSDDDGRHELTESQRPQRSKISAISCLGALGFLRALSPPAAAGRRHPRRR